MQKFLNGAGEVVKWILIGLLIMIVAFGLLMILNKFLPEGSQVTVDVLLALAAMTLSLAFKLFPKLRVKFAVLASGNKAVINLVAVTVMAVLVYLMTCAQLISSPGIECTQASATGMAKEIFWVIVANQVTHIATQKPADVLAAEADPAS